MTSVSFLKGTVFNRNGHFISTIFVFNPFGAKYQTTFVVWIKRTVGHERSLITIFTGRSKDSQGYKVSSCGLRRL